MRLINITSYILLSFILNSFFTINMENNTVLVCYGKLKPETTKGYKYLIVESKHYLPSDIRVFKAQKNKVFAYISVGEVNANAPHFEILKNNTLGKNEVWNSYYLNLKSENTIKILMQIIDQTLAKGYDGLFIDNIDNFTIHGVQKDQKNEVIQLLKSIKEKYPQKEFIQNAGLELINETSIYVNAVLIESVASNYSFKDKKYKLREAKEFVKYFEKIKKINETNKIPFILVEYADSISLKNEIENRIKPSNFDYFIGQIDLQTIPKFK